MIDDGIDYCDSCGYVRTDCKCTPLVSGLRERAEEDEARAEDAEAENVRLREALTKIARGDTLPASIAACALDAS